MDDPQTDKKPPEEESGSVEKGKQKQKNETWRPQGRRDPFELLDMLPEKEQQEFQKALHLLSFNATLPKTLQQAKKRTYRFWETQPVPKLGDSVTSHGPIAEADASIREEPYPLPQGFSWDTLDPRSPPVLQELRRLLNDNYTQDDDNTIRCEFSEEYLQWTLLPPGWQIQWNCGVRVDSNRKLVGFIAAVPANVRTYQTDQRLVHVKLLCVHKKLRLKRMTPILIRELTRRVNQRGLHQAVYTAPILLPTPLSSCRLWLRPLNPRKLMEVEFSGLKQNMTLQRARRLLRLPETTKTRGLRPMTKDDVAGVHSLLRETLCQFHLSPLLSLRDVDHWLLPRESVIDTHVVEGEDGALTDVVSFCSTSFRVLNHQVHTGLRAAHLLYLASTATSQVHLMEDALVLAKSKGFDVFSALDVMNNSSFLETLKFNVSPTNTHYYLYNWMCPAMTPDQVGLTLPH